MISDLKERNGTKVPKSAYVVWDADWAYILIQTTINVDTKYRVDDKPDPREGTWVIPYLQ